MKKGILFIGPIAEQGGPAIKNKILIKYLDTCGSLEIWNTYDRSLRARAGAVLRILFTKRRYIIVSVSRKGRILLYPFLLLKKNVSKIQYACIVIGGNAVESLRSRICINAMRRADLVTVETKTLAGQFERLFGLSNVYWMPNYKELPEMKKESLSPNRFKNTGLKFLFLSSMRDAKGVPALLEAFKNVLQKGYEASLDFYGPIKHDLDPGILGQIENLEHIRYCGFAENDKVLDLMSRYDVFIFPTEYTGEGFPAVLVEAQAAGLPVIASDMNYNPEIIRENRNGWIFEHGNVDQLTERIAFCLDHREELFRISLNNEQDAREYDAEHVIDSFKAELRRSGWTI